MTRKAPSDPFNPHLFSEATNAAGGDGLAGIFAMLGIPTMTERPGGGFNLQRPQDFLPNKPNTNTNTNNTNTEDKYPRNQIPSWWEEWNKNFGRYGVMPPVQGLL